MQTYPPKSLASPRARRGQFWILGLARQKRLCSSRWSSLRLVSCELRRWICSRGNGVNEFSVSVNEFSAVHGSSCCCARYGGRQLVCGPAEAQGGSTYPTGGSDSIGVNEQSTPKIIAVHTVRSEGEAASCSSVPEEARGRERVPVRWLCEGVS